MKNDRAGLMTPVIALFAFGLGAAAFAQGQLNSAGTNDWDIHTNLSTLTQVAQIRQLSLTQARQNHPVKLRGVVLDYSSLPTLFVSDETGGIYVKMNTDQKFIQGQVIEIEGTSDAGKFAPMVIPSRLQVVGAGSLPSPRDVSFQRLASGVEDSQWVRVAGIVQSASQQNLRRKLVCPKLTLATEDGRQLDVLVDDYQGEPVKFLVDAEVVVTGIVESIYNGKRQLINFRLLAPGMKFIETRRPAPGDLWGSPPRPIASLRQFSPEEPSGHRVKVAGIVTFQQPGQCIFIRDETGSIRVETPEPGVVAPGDRIEALGFPAVYDYTPVLKNAIFTKAGSSQPVPPVHLTAKQARQGDYGADLICIEAQLLDQFRTPDELILVLQEDDNLFRAELAKPQAAAISVRNGARLRVTGICLAQSENSRVPSAFQILLRSPGDLTILRQPSWWSPERLRWAVLGLTGVVLGTGIWVWTLKRQVRVQTKAISEKIEREAILQERMRIARELHDSLEQELAGVRMQLDLTAATVASAPDTAVANLQMARTMVCHSQAEARRSVWELRSQVLENRTLPTALAATVGCTENGAPVEVKVSGEPRQLPMRVESNLLRIAQEATTNAIRHAKPRHISVHLAYETNGARLKICDDGCGFYVAQAPAAQEGHFGLLGMRERMDKIGGTLHVTSVPGKGTCVEVFVPTAENGVKNLA